MNYISLADKEVVPVSKWILRKTVKIIIQNKEGKIAMVTNPIYNFFLLPGGGVEEGEDVFTAAGRESREEALCQLLILSFSEPWRNSELATKSIMKQEGFLPTKELLIQWMREQKTRRKII